MGNCVNSRVREIIADCFPENLAFDAVYVCSDGKINDSSDSIDMEGKKRVCFCFLDKRSFSYTLHVAKHAEIQLYTCYELDSVSEVHISCGEHSYCEQIVMQNASSQQDIFVRQEQNSTYRGGYFQLYGRNNRLIPFPLTVTVPAAFPSSKSRYTFPEAISPRMLSSE